MVTTGQYLVIFVVLCVLAWILVKFYVNQLFIWIGTATVSGIAFWIGRRTSAGESIFGLIVLGVICLVLGAITRVVLGWYLGQRAAN